MGNPECQTPNRAYNEFVAYIGSVTTLLVLVLSSRKVGMELSSIGMSLSSIGMELVPLRLHPGSYGLYCCPLRLMRRLVRIKQVLLGLILVLLRMEL